jgi:hypothetical protein
MKYSLSPKLLECFDWNTNIKEFVMNLQKNVQLESNLTLKGL